MRFDLELSIAQLERMPSVLDPWLRGADAAWTRSHSGPESWSAFDVVGHLIHGERTDWMPRLRIILEDGEARPFDEFDRFAQQAENANRSLGSLLDHFSELRASNLRELRELQLTPEDLARTGTHPTFGRVTASELLATWTAHDLAHLSQIARTQLWQYREAMGPWRQFFSSLAE
ncbi:MAG: DinB family protein [Planctomycetota bacterium]